MKPKLFLTVGLPGSGKTTKAKELEDKFDAIRFTPDEYIIEIFGTDLNIEQRDSLREPVEHALWTLAENALRLARNVIVDFGLWTVEERNSFRESGESYGAEVFFVQCYEPIEILWERISSRPESQSGTLEISRQDLQTWWDLFQPLTESELKYVYDNTLFIEK